MIKFNKLNYSIIISILFVSVLLNNCSRPKNISHLHGQNDLFEKSKKLKVKFSNKNDIIKILGNTIAKDPIDKNIWYYIERLEKTNIYGKKITVRNNFLVLKIDNNGILDEIKFYNKNDIINLNIDKSETISLGVDNSLIKSILKTSKKRIENQSKNIQK